MAIAILYEYANFKGDFFILRSDDKNLADDGWDNKVSLLYRKRRDSNDFNALAAPSANLPNHKMLMCWI